MSDSDIWNSDSVPDHAHIAKQVISPIGRTPDAAGQQVRRTRRAIAEAAARAFTRDGYNETTIDTVAAGAGVSPRTVHRHFGTKSALLAAGVAVRVADFLHRLDALVAGHEPLASAIPTALENGFLESTPDSRSLINVAHRESEVWGRWLEAFYRHQSRLAAILSAADGHPEESDNLDWTLRAGMLLNALSTTYQLWAETPDGDLDAMMQVAVATTLPVVTTGRTDTAPPITNG
jgi:AcrR family transcriptional regulator